MTETMQRNPLAAPAVIACIALMAACGGKGGTGDDADADAEGETVCTLDLTAGETSRDCDGLRIAGDIFGIVIQINSCTTPLSLFGAYSVGDLLVENVAAEQAEILSVDVRVFDGASIACHEEIGLTTVRGDYGDTSVSEFPMEIPPGATLALSFGLDDALLVDDCDISLAACPDTLTVETTLESRTDGTDRTVVVRTDRVQCRYDGDLCM